MADLSEKKFYTTGDIAKIFGVSRISTYKWVKQGKIKAFKIPGGRYRITPKALNDFIRTSGLEEKISIPVCNTIKLLIVDDEKPLADLVKDYLESKHSHWHICTAYDGFEAGQLITKIFPDVILLDLFLPGINGFYLCRKIRNDEETKHIKIITITGYPTEENIEKIKECGIDALIKKPFELEEMEKVILNVINRNSLKRNTLPSF